MKRVGQLLAIFLLLSSALLIITDAYASDKVFFTSIDNLTTATIYTVPAGKKFILGSVVIGNYNANPVCCARMFRVTSTETKEIFYVAVPANGYFDHVFKNVVFQEGDDIQVRNGASSGIINFTVTGSLVIK